MERISDERLKHIAEAGLSFTPVEHLRVVRELIAYLDSGALEALKEIVEHFGDPLRVARPAIAKLEALK